jgi:CheY-like chemotaxis protein
VTGLAPGQTQYRILIVEDKWENRALLKKLLEPLGFEVREATNGQEGIDVYKEWHPHLIFMDMRMPVMDGYEATQRIKASTNGQAVAVIALTASAFEHERAHILSVGCDDFVRKPFRQSVLFQKIAEHLGVVFTYEAPSVSAEQDEPTPALTPEALRGLSAEWRAELSQAAATARYDKALSLIEHVRADHPAVAGALIDLINEFRFNIVLELIGD